MGCMVASPRRRKEAGVRNAAAEDARGDVVTGGNDAAATDIRIVRAGKEDALEFYRVEAGCFEMDGNDADTLYYWVPILAHQCCYKAVAAGSRIVGGVVSMPTFDRQWYINSLFVDPEYRKRGIARMLMDKVFSVAQYDEIILDVKTDRPHLTRFYASLGFVIRGRSRNHYQDGEDRFLMVRKNGSGMA